MLHANASPMLEHLIFHFNGKEYIVFDALTFDEIGAITKMTVERNKKLKPLDAKSTRRYFEDTDKMIAALLRRCFHMTDKQIEDMGQMERRSLGSAFITFLATATDRFNRL